MKIVIDARLYGLENAGLGRYVMNLVNHLAALDFENSYTILLRKKYYTQLKLPNKWKKVLTDYRHYGFAEQILLPKVLDDEKPDLVHFPHFNVPYVIKNRFIVTIHDLLMHRQKGFEATTLHPVSYLIKRLGYRVTFDRAITRSVGIIVPSYSVKRDIVDFYGVNPEKITVTYEGVDDAIYTEHDNNNILEKYGLNGDYFIYTGNAYPHKNLIRAIEAICSLNLIRKKETQFAIVSSRNAFVKKLELQVRRLHAEKYVKLLGFVPDCDLGLLYKASKAFVFPSTSEGFGLPGLEAMQAGTLVLASDIPIFKEVYKDNAIFFNPFDFSAVENAYATVLDMKSKEREKRIKRGRQFSTRYSWRKMAEETLKIYNSAIL